MDLITPFVLYSSIEAITVLLLAAMTGVMSNRVGVFNMALEGQMLIGAFAAVLFSFWFGSAWAGMFFAIIFVILFSTILAFGATVFQGNTVVICIGMNLLASGLTAFLLRSIFEVGGTFSDPAIVSLPRLSFAFLDSLGSFGRVVNGHTVVTYFSWVAVIAVTVMLYGTRLGLRIRGVGENASAASTLGVSVTKLRIAVVSLSGGLVALAGAQLALGSVRVFSEDMSAGRGWIALVAVMLARDRPIVAAGACILFGVMDAIGLRLQMFGLPSQASVVVPYVATLIVLIFSQMTRKQRVSRLEI